MATQNPTQAKLPKIPPHSIEAEQSVLGGVLLDQTAWDHIAGLVNYTDFYLPDHQVIFQAITSLADRNQPLDYLTVTEELKINYPSCKISEAYILELSHNTPSAANIVAYAEIVRARSVLRQLISASSDISTLAFNPEGRDAKDVLDEAEQAIFKIGEEGNKKGSGPLIISHILKNANTKLEALQQGEGMMSGLPTGFIELDNMTSGLNPGDLIIVAGRPAMGKTSFVMNIAEHVAGIEKKATLVFSMEMPNEQLALRMLSSHGRIDQHKLRTGKLNSDDWCRINSAVATLSNMPLYIDDSPALSPSEMRARARRIKRQQGDLGLILVDYLQLMQIPGFKENRTNEISTISRFLKVLAKELNVPVIALSQLNRSLEQRHDRRPLMSDLRESGAIEQDADIIVFIYRDEVYNEESLDKGTAEIIVAKQRNGPTGKVRLTFMGQYTKFQNYAPPDPMEARMGP